MERPAGLAAAAHPIALVRLPAGVEVCAEPLGHRPLRCTISERDGSDVIGIDMAGTYQVASRATPVGTRLTTPGFRLPVVVREGKQVRDVDQGYR